MKQKILALLDAHRIMTIATLRPDGWPQATTVGYVNEGLTLWFLCGLESQKAKNLAFDNRVSITIDHDTPDIMSITGLSMAARAYRVSDRARPGPPSISYVRGDLIVVRMRTSGANDVERVDVRGQVDGVQLEPARQRPDSLRVDSLRTRVDSLRRNGTR